MIAPATSLRIPRRHRPDERGRLTQVTPQNAGWRYVGFEVVELAPGIELPADRHEDREVCIVPLDGVIRVSIDAGPWHEVGERTSVFDGPPHAFYVPPRSSYRLAPTEGVATCAVCSAPATRGDNSPRHVLPSENPTEVRGDGPMRRTVRPILMGNQPAESLFVVEVLTPAGLWSSFPPHKHDVDDPPRERYLEETYHHRMRPLERNVAASQGLAVQGLYEAGGRAVDRQLGSLFAVRDGDTVLVPRGYHPVSAAPGYDLYYLNVMAGPVREWLVTLDPDHAWMAPPPMDQTTQS